MEADLTLIVSGTRDANTPEHWYQIESMLWFTHHQFQTTSGIQRPRVRLVQGGAKGADAISDAVAKRWGWQTEPVPAKWQECGLDCPPGPHRRQSKNQHHGAGSEYCPYAGHRRNQEMLDKFGLEALLLLAFPKRGKREDSGGTWDMIERTSRFGLDVVVHSLVIDKQQQGLW